MLELDDDELIAALGGRQRDRLRDELASSWISTRCARARIAAGLETICACDPAYPPALRALAAPPAVLHVAGGLERLLELADSDPVALVGSRRASPYGLEVARSLGRGLASAGLPVVSGMALGIDSAAHAGALEAGAPTVAVLPGSADRPYPAGKRALHRRIVAGGAAVSELGPGTSVRRWMFLARNRIIAALAAMTVVVEAGERSGALVTARVAARARPAGGRRARAGSPRPRRPGPTRCWRPARAWCASPRTSSTTCSAPGCGARPTRDPQPPAELRPLLSARSPRATTRSRRWRGPGSTPSRASPRSRPSSSTATSGAAPADGSR